MYRRLTKPSCEKAKFASNDPLTENMIRSPCTETDKKRKLIRWETSRMSPLRFFANYLPYTLDSQIYSEATLFLIFFLFFLFFLHLSDLFSSNPH